MALGCLAGILALGAARDADQDTLTIHATGFANARGHAIAKLYQPGDDVLGPGRWQSTATIVNGQARFVFSGLPRGRYAAVAFHDENDSGSIDHNALGVPSEAIGFSNGFALGLLSGLPRFDKLRFEYAGEKQRIEIVVK